MSSLQRGLRDLSRKKLRTAAVVIVIGLALGVYLALSSIAVAVQQEVSYLESEVESTVQVSLNGSGGGYLTSGPLNASIVPTVLGQAHVSAVQTLALDRYAPTTGAISCQGGRRSLCVLLEGENVSLPLVIYGGGSPSAVTGRLLGPGDEGTTNAIVGTALASRMGWSTSDTFEVNSTTFTMVGTFTTGTQFGDSSVLLPYPSAVRALGSTGPSLLYVTVDSPANDDLVVSELRSALGAGYDVVALINSEVPAIQSATNSISALTGFASTIALGLGTLIIVFVMVIATRERVREIGLLKALGFRNSRIVLESLYESVALASLGFVVGIVLLELLEPTLSNLFSARGVAGSAAGGGISLLLGNSSSFAPPALLFAETLGIALLMGFMGALYPIVRAIRLRPAEALRYE